MATFTLSSKSRTFSTLHALNTAKDDGTLSEGEGWRLTWTTDTGGTDSVVGKISGGELYPHPLKTGFLPSRVIGEGTKGYTILDATRVSTDANGDLVIFHGPLTAVGDFVRVLLINGISIDRNVDKIITVWDADITTPTNDMGIFQRIENSLLSTNWGQAGILRTGGSWVSDVRRSADSVVSQGASTAPGASFRVEMNLIHGTGSTVATAPDAQSITGDVGSEGDPTSPLQFSNINNWNTTADFRISFETLDITGGGVATFTLKELWVVPNSQGLGLPGGGSDIGDYTTYANLPSSGVSDGTLARVTTTDAAGIYIYKATVGGDAFGMWVPDWIGSRINDYLRDGSSNPAKISTASGLGSDTSVSIASRGWTVTPGTGSITDVGGDIDFSGNTSGVDPKVEFTPSAVPDGMYFIVLEADAILYAGGVLAASARFFFQTGSYIIGITYTANGVLDRIQGTSAFNVLEGDGFIDQSAFDRIFILVRDMASPSGVPIVDIWTAAQGYTANDTRSQALLTDYAASANLDVSWYGRSFTGFTNQSRIREIHVFTLN